jgi:hypothetical protein
MNSLKSKQSPIEESPVVGKLDFNWFEFLYTGGAIISPMMCKFELGEME